MKLVSRAALFALVVLAFGCSASNPEDRPVTLEPDAAPQEESVSLRVDPPPVSTPWSAFPIAGVGPGNGTLIYSVAGFEDTVRLGATGEFCIDVSLADGDNSIKIEAISAAGDFSEPEFLSIRREGEPPAPEPQSTEVQLSDRTPGTSFYASEDTGVGSYNPFQKYSQVYLDSGTFAELVDGNESESVKFHGLDVGNGEIVAFALKERMAVHSFEITTPPTGDETCGPEGFQVWVSDENEPELQLDGVSWVKVAEVDVDSHVAAGTTYELDSVVAGINAKYVALKMTNSSCVDAFNLDLEMYIYYAINEIRVIAEKDGTGTGKPRDGAPSCATGGF